MTIAAATRFGPYEILGLLGSGGMGEVYRALDTRLGRTVALKVLRSDLAARPLARSRFEREARAISKLSHAHICALFDVGQQDGVDFLVMEYLEGQTLSRRLDRGPLPLDRTLRHAREIASALACAHRAGVVHRDLKPGNVMMTPTGAKLLDFGLAKSPALEALHPPIDSSVSTATENEHTQDGTVVGTLHYLAPELLRGEEADFRSDIFALGALIHEMATGRKAFEGDSAGAVMSAILSSEPVPISSLAPLTPPALDRLVITCLAKEPDDRWQTVADLARELEWIARDSTDRRPALRETEKERPGTARRRAAWIAGALLVLAGAWWLGRPRSAPLPDAHSRQITAATGWETDPAISPDGTLVAYASNESGQPDIWMVDIGGGSALRLTHDEAADRDPAWLPDGSAIVFVSERAAGPGIWKVPRLGDEPTLVLSGARDPAISPDGTRIAFARPGARGELRIGMAPLADPSQARLLTQDGDGLWDHRRPAWSPDGLTICYQGQRDLWLVPTAGGKARRLTVDSEFDFEPFWSPDGRFVYFASNRDGTIALWRVPAEGGRPARVTMGTGPERRPSISRDGKRLVYSTLFENPDVVLLDRNRGTEHQLPGPRYEWSPAIAPDRSAVAFMSDRQGGRFDIWIQPLLDGAPQGTARRVTESGSVAYPAWSPDGRWIAYFKVTGPERDIWVVPATGGPSERFTDDPAADVQPSWSPDGSRIAFASDRGGPLHVWTAAVVDGKPAGAPVQLTTGPTSDTAPVWSPDGKQIAFLRQGSHGGNDVWVTSSDAKGTVRRLTETGDAGRIVWDRRAPGLYVSAFWGEGQVSLRRIDLADGRIRSLHPAFRLGYSPENIEFDVSWDGSLVSFIREELRGDIWVMEARGRGY